MGSLLCTATQTAEEPAPPPPRSSRRVRSRTSLAARGAAQPRSPAVDAVLCNFDLLQRVLLMLAPGHGCSVAERLQLAGVCRLWRDVARTLPVQLTLHKPLSDAQVEHLASGRLARIRHLAFAGSEESRAHEVLASAAFQAGSAASLASVVGLPFQDDMCHLRHFGELASVGLCRRNWVTLLELVRGTLHSTQHLAALPKLRSLALRDLAGPQAALDLRHLPPGLRDLHLVNTSFVHHPEMQLPPTLHLDSLTATSLGRRSTVVPVELLRRTKQAILRGKEVYLTGPPTDWPVPMGEDSIEVVLNNGMLFLFGFGQPCVRHETEPGAILAALEQSDLQVLRLSTEAGGTAHLVERSDCRRGLRWKSLEVAAPSQLFARLEAVGEAPASGFGCRVEQRHADGSVHSLRLARAGTPRAQADAALQHLVLLQQFLMAQVAELEAHVRQLGQQVAPLPALPE